MDDYSNPVIINRLQISLFLSFNFSWFNYCCFLFIFLDYMFVFWGCVPCKLGQTFKPEPQMMPD